MTRASRSSDSATCAASRAVSIITRCSIRTVRERSIAPGDALVLIAPHAPVPLLALLAERGPVDVEYLVEGPDEWQVRVTRLASPTA